MEEELEERKVTFFLQFGGETKKVSDHFVSSPSHILAAFRQKYSCDLADSAISFYIKDKQFGVEHKLEVIDQDFSDGVVVEARTVDSPLSKKRNLTTESEASKKHKPEARAPVERKVPDDGACVVLLKGLPWDCTKDEIAKFFEGVSIVPDSILIATNASGHQIGDGYVQCVDEDSVGQALKLNRKSIGRRYIELSRSNLAEKQKAMTRSLPWDHKGRSDTTNGPVSTSSHVVKMRGLPFGCTEEDCKQFFFAS
mmetsp:Transcript_8986/g.17189  ORF Transcript_8986/g.17189 Transcript_8986/m.17189 type:complete len:254 (+) Transcript_8986:34-795(+)